MERFFRDPGEVGGGLLGRPRGVSRAPRRTGMRRERGPSGSGQAWGGSAPWPEGKSSRGGLGPGGVGGPVEGVGRRCEQVAEWRVGCRRHHGEAGPDRERGSASATRDGSAHLGFVQPLSEPVHHRRAGPARPRRPSPPQRCAWARLRRGAGGRGAGPGRAGVPRGPGAPGGRRQVRGAGAPPGDARRAARGTDPQTAVGRRTR